MQNVDLSICVTCQHAGAHPGKILHHHIEEMLPARPHLRLHAVECMSVCKRPCTIALSSPGKWTYIIGDLDVTEDVGAILEYVDRYATSPHGTPPLKERPAAIRRGTIARLPPHTHSENRKEDYANTP